MRPLTKIAMISLPVAAMVGAGTGTAVALWSQSFSTSYSVATAQNTYSLTSGSTSDSAAGDGNATLSLGGPTDAKTLVDTGWLFYPITMKWSSTGDQGVTYSLAENFAATTGVLSSAEKAIYDVTSNPGLCSSSGWPGAGFITGNTGVLETSGVLRNSTVEKTKVICVGFKLKATGSYTNVGSVNATASNGATATATDSWSVKTVPDTTKEEPFTVKGTTAYTIACTK